MSCQRGVGRSSRCRHCGALQRVRGYEVREVLSVGPRGRVYRAERGGAAYVLKELAFATVPDIKSIDLFERECQVLQRLSHPRVPRFVEGFEDGQGVHRRLFLVHHFLPGESLEAKLRTTIFTEGVARRVASDVLEVLQYLHGCSPRVVHRDLKPANVLALPDGGYALVDFGSVRLSGADGSVRSTIAGTFGYMPPEQLGRDADERSDLYALGMTLLRVLSRRRPEQLLNAALEVEFRAQVNVSQPFADFIGRLVAKDRTARFLDATSALRALQAACPVHVPQEVEVRPTRELPVVKEPAPIQVALAKAAPVRPESSRGAPHAAVRGEQPAAVLPLTGVWPWRIRIGAECLTLSPGSAYLIGRENDCDLYVDERLHRADTVSRRHARLTVTAAGLEVEDLGSTNGTFAGDTLLHGSGRKTVVRRGTTLQLGRVVCDVWPAWERTYRPEQLLGYWGGDPEGVRVVYPSELERARRHGQ